MLARKQKFGSTLSAHEQALEAATKSRENMQSMNSEL